MTNSSVAIRIRPPGAILFRSFKKRERLPAMTKLFHNRSRNRPRTNGRTLRFETLENRYLLATFEVGTLSIDSSSMVSPGPGLPLVHTLRSAIIAANNNPNIDVADVITFKSGLSGTLTVVNGPMNVTDHVQIIGPSHSN